MGGRDDEDAAFMVSDSPNSTIEDIRLDGYEKPVRLTRNEGSTIRRLAATKQGGGEPRNRLEEIAIAVLVAFVAGVAVWGFTKLVGG